MEEMAGMIYTIEETDLERQHLLAQYLDPISLNALATVSLPNNATILDIGCGLGDTTLMLDKRFPNSIIKGLDADASLIKEALQEKKPLHPNLDFVHGDASHLPFEDNHFDFVFTRCCLHHLPSAIEGLKEMKRVCRPGGIVFAHEPDINSILSYPESWAYAKHTEYLKLLFADAFIGRKLISYFREVKLQNIFHHIETILGDHHAVPKKFVTLTGIAIGNSLLQKNIATKEEHKALVRELTRAQHDADTIIIMPPSIAVWGTKAE